MGTSQTQNSNGMTSRNKYAHAIGLFVSPKTFWSVYGYWFFLVYHVLYRHSGNMGSFIDFPEWLKPFMPEYYGDGEVLSFFTIPFFFIITLGIITWKIYRRDLKTAGYFALHIFLIILFSAGVHEMVDRFVWVYGR